MNVVPGYEVDQSVQDLAPEVDQSESELAAIVGMIRRQLPLIVMMILLGLAGAGLYLFTATKWYTASAEVLMEMRRNLVLNQDPFAEERPIDSSLVESQVATVKSERVSKAAIKALNLTEDPEFTLPHYGPFTPIVSAIGNLLGIRSNPSKDEILRAVTGRFEDRLSARRIPMTYVIEISFAARTPEKAARIANQIAEAYISDQLQSKFEASQRAETWLQERVDELREQSATSDRNVLDFKLANNIMTADGRPVDDRRIADYDQRLNEARGRTAETRARLDRVTQIIESGQIDATVSDVLSNNVVVQLRQRFLDTSARAADWAKRYGEQHNAVITLRNETKQLQQAMLEELKRIQQTYRSDYEIAKAREQAAEKALDDEFQRSGQSRVAQVKLRELEGVAQTARSLYDNFVQRRMQAAQQQSLPITDARVITNATPPEGTSYPQMPLVMALGLAAGLGSGVGIGFIREILNRTVRNKRQLEKASGVPCLGLLPKVRSSTLRSERRPRLRTITPRRSEFIQVIRSPFSQFAEGIRSIKLAADLNLSNESGVVIGIISSLPGEGKSTIAANLAFLTATTGSRVLLIDCDMRKPALTYNLVSHVETGLHQVLTQSLDNLDGILWTHEATGLHLLPASLKDNPDNTGGLLNSPAMEQLLKTARAHYDYIILDFAPMLPVIDVRATANLVDGFVLIAEWAKAPRDAVSEAVSLSSSVRTRLIGCVLNKVDMKQLRRYGEYDGKYYSRYFRQ